MLNNFPNAQYDGTWGLWNHEALALFSGELDKLQPPFYLTFFFFWGHTILMAITMAESPSLLLKKMQKILNILHWSIVFCFDF